MRKEIRLSNGEKAVVIDRVTEMLNPYYCEEYPNATYNGYELYIDVTSGELYAVECAGVVHAGEAVND
jgi:hypothetical protein